MLSKIKNYRLGQHRSFFMLVRIHFRHHGFGFPIPLYLIDQTLEVIGDLVWFFEKIFNGWVNHHYLNSSPQFKYWKHTASSPSKALQLCREIIRELRSYGKWRFVEVETANKHGREVCRIYIDFI
jgi:hypothetical protein